LKLAWRITDTLKFVLGRSLENYKERFQSFRKKIDEESLKWFRTEATKIVKNIFGIEVEKS
jgi:hypothetical protein